MIRLVAWNVNGALDRRAVGTVLAALRPDVACLVETPGRIPLRQLGSAAQLTIAARAGRRRLATAVLVGDRVRVLSSARIPLPCMAGSPERAAAQAILGVGALRFSVVALQLGLRPDARREQAREMARFLGTLDVPSIVAGDLNEPPGGPAGQHLGEQLRDAFAVAGQGRGETYPTPQPTARHDHVLVAPQLEVERCWVPDEPPVDVASHHRPVVVDIATSETEADQPTPLDARPDPAEAGDTAEPAA